MAMGKVPRPGAFFVSMINGSTEMMFQSKVLLGGCLLPIL